MYCTTEVLEDLLVETPGGIKGEYLFRVAPLDKPLPGGSKKRGKFRLSSVQESFPENKLIATLMDKRASNHRIQHKLTVCSKDNERIKIHDIVQCKVFYTRWL